MSVHHSTLWECSNRTQCGLIWLDLHTLSYNLQLVISKLIKIMLLCSIQKSYGVCGSSMTLFGGLSQLLLAPFFTSMAIVYEGILRKCNYHEVRRVAKHRVLMYCISESLQMDPRVYTVHSQSKAKLTHRTLQCKCS